MCDVCTIQRQMHLAWSSLFKPGQYEFLENSQFFVLFRFDHTRTSDLDTGYHPHVYSLPYTIYWYTMLPLIHFPSCARAIGRNVKSVKIDQNRPEPSKSLISLSPQSHSLKLPKRVQLRLVGTSIHTCNISCLALRVREIRIFQCA
jgi:hypothetical protein